MSTFDDDKMPFFDPGSCPFLESRDITVRWDQIYLLEMNSLFNLFFFLPSFVCLFTPLFLSCDGTILILLLCVVGYKSTGRKKTKRRD